MHAGIVGMGIMGRLLALALQHKGWQVKLFDQSEGQNNCSEIAAGLLTPISECDKAHPIIFQLGLASIKIFWPRILEQLSERPHYFRKNGCMVVCHSHDVAEWQYLSQCLKNKFPLSNTYWQVLSKESLLQLEPELYKFESGYYFPEEAHLDCQLLLNNLNQHLIAQGVEFFLNNKVLALGSRNILTAKKSYKLDLVFDCRGMGARFVFKDLRAVRGELICLHAPDVNLQRPLRLLHPRYSLYIVPRPGNIYLIGASEIESEDYSPISVRTSLELLTAAYSIHPGFAEARIIETRTHCRPTLASHLPCIHYMDGLVAVNGLYRHGYLVAPALVEEILSGIKTKQQDIHYPELWKSL
ncbi:MAG: FAD-dependent oxidoreductase [Candidatus Aquirickettsiella sp.]